MPVATAWRTKEVPPPPAGAKSDGAAGASRSDLRLGFGRRATRPDRRIVARPALAALGVLLIVGCATAGVLLSSRSNHDKPYLVVLKALTPGETVSTRDLGVVALDPPAGLAAVPVSEEASVIGLAANYGIPAGSLLDPGELTSAPSVVAGDAVIGASLDPNQLPDELTAGDQVIVVLTSSGGQIGTALGSPTGPPAGTPAASPGATSQSHAAAGNSGHSGQAAPIVGSVLATALVLDVTQPGSSAASAVANNQVTVSLAVPDRSAALVTAASAASEISLALVPSQPSQPTNPGKPGKPGKPKSHGARRS